MSQEAKPEEKPEFKPMYLDDMSDYDVEPRCHKNRNCPGAFLEYNEETELYTCPKCSMVYTKAQV